MIQPATIDVMTDPDLLGPFFAGASWNIWRAVVKASQARPLSVDEREIFYSVAKRDAPEEPVEELVVVAGRGAGKDSAASAIATAAAVRDYGTHLRPGERATVLCLACDRQQAKIVLRYIKGYFATVPLLQALVERETEDGLELNNRVEIIVATNDYRAVRGRTIVCVIMDEAAFYGGDSAASSAREVYNALVPALARVPGSVMIIISSPWKREGLLYDKWIEGFGKPDPRLLVVQGESRTFNPTIPEHIVTGALARDPEVARAEWLAQWRDDLNNFIDRALVEAALDRGVLARPPVSNTHYVAGCDPSGGRSDSFTYAVAHREGEMIILDMLGERRAPFNPTEVVAEIAASMKPYGCMTITGDRYAAQWVVEAFAKVGINYAQSERERSAIYLDVLPLFTAGRARLVDNQRMVTQFAALERRVFSTGRDRIDHAPNGADDNCNSAALALVLAAGERDGMEIWRKLGAD